MNTNKLALDDGGARIPVRYLTLRAGQHIFDADHEEDYWTRYNAAD